MSRYRKPKYLPGIYASPIINRCRELIKSNNIVDAQRLILATLQSQIVGPSIKRSHRNYRTIIVKR